MWRVVAIGGFLLMALMTGRAQATLFDRGNGLVYDDFDNLSWTQNAAISWLNPGQPKGVCGQSGVGRL